MTIDPYRGLGVGYAVRRRTDPAVDAHVTHALRGCRSVINVGAGAGSYEPPGTVLAVDPSATMLAQRPAGTAPAVLADDLDSGRWRRRHGDLLGREELDVGYRLVHARCSPRES